MLATDWAPLDWKIAEGFLPLLARDIEAPALASLAELMRDSVPWKTKELRRRYHRLAAPIVKQSLGQIGDWALTSGLLLEVMEVPQPSTSPQEETGGGRVFDVSATRFSPEGALLRLLPLLPDVDRPKRHFLRRKKDSIGVLAAEWCMNVTDEWLQEIREARERRLSKAREERRRATSNERQH